MSQTDFLTGCLSKEAIEVTLAKLKAECDLDKIPFSILVLDLDHFKTYNDKYGHLDGDDILKYFASTLRISFQEVGAFIFRFGGDEFLVAFQGKGGKDSFLIANHVMKILKKRPFLSRGRIYKLSFSGGIASYPNDGHETETIIQKADKAMYFSKTHGRGRNTLYGQILWKTIKRILFILTVLLSAGGILFYFKHSSYKDYIVKRLKKEIGKAGIALAPPPAKINFEGIDFVYLKSGRILKGIIIRDDKDEIELNLNLETGKGTTTIKKSDIERIKPSSKKVLPEGSQK